jgi:hypothetical protein
MFKLVAMGLTVISLLALMASAALAGACLAKDTGFTQCTEYPKGADETMIKSQCEKFNQEYVIECPAPQHKYCVQGDRKVGRIFTWGTDVDVEACDNGTWHP